jgi:hypothetical protein
VENLLFMMGNSTFHPGCLRLLAEVPICGKSKLLAFLQCPSSGCDAACDSFETIFAASAGDEA